MLILLSGNFVSGFTAFVMPEGLTLDEQHEINEYFATRVPESRLVELKSADELIEKVGPYVPAPEGKGLDDIAEQGEVNVPPTGDVSGASDQSPKPTGGGGDEVST